MPNYSPAAVANAFVDLAGHSMPQMKLQKLTYIADGWNMAITGVPLVDAQPEAWDNGPVFRSIWNRLRDMGSANGKIRDYDGSIPAAPFTDQEQAIIRHAPFFDQEQAIIRHVWNKYGQKSARELSDLTHQPNTPWTRAYYSRGRNAVISNEDVRTHYLALAQAGRVST